MSVFLPIGSRRGLFGSVPAWVIGKYAPYGPIPDIASDFTKNLHWQRGYGQMSCDAAYTDTRASTEYVQNAAGLWTSVPNATLARSDLGLNSWKAATNWIRNSAAQGAVVGTPGTTPTNWFVPSSVVSVSRQIVGFGTDAATGMDYIDIRFSGTASGSGATQINADSGTGATASTAQIWTPSAFLALVGGSLSNISFIQYELDEYNSTTFLGSQFAATNLGPSLTSSLVRSQATFTTAQATVNNVRHLIRVLIAGAGAVDITLRIGWPQLELGPFATPPVRTTGSTNNRAEDLNKLVTTIPQSSQYALYTRAGCDHVPASFPNSLYLSNGSGTDFISLTTNSVSNHRVSVKAANVTQWDANAGGSIGISTDEAWAIGASVAGGYSAYNGTLGNVGAISAMPTISQFNAGNGQATGTSWCGNVKSSAIWWSALPTAAQLVSLTAAKP